MIQSLTDQAILFTWHNLSSTHWSLKKINKALEQSSMFRLQDYRQAMAVLAVISANLSSRFSQTNVNSGHVAKSMVAEKVKETAAEATVVAKWPKPAASKAKCVSAALPPLHMLNKHMTHCAGRFLI